MWPSECARMRGSGRANTSSAFGVGQHLPEGAAPRAAPAVGHLPGTRWNFAWPKDNALKRTLAQKHGFRRPARASYLCSLCPRAVGFIENSFYLRLSDMAHRAPHSHSPLKAVRWKRQP